jgi:hypothetical protein
MFNVKLIGGDSVANSAGSVKELQAVVGPVRLFSVTAYNASAGTLNLQVHDASAAPADGAAPIMTVPVPTKQVAALDWESGRPMVNGVYICWSTSASDVTKTLVAANSGLLDVVFRRTE